MTSPSITSPFTAVTMDSDYRQFLQSNLYFTDYSTTYRTSFVPMADGSNRGKGIVRRRKELWVDGSRGPYYQRMTIDSLPDDALLEILKIYVDNPDFKNGYDSAKIRHDVWHTLVHVCRRWQNVVFSSPRCLKLELVCTYGRPVREMDNIWPELPIIVETSGGRRTDGVENLIAALKLNHRVSRIRLWGVRNSTLERFVAVMQVPFPSLAELNIWSQWNEPGLVLSDEFLGGSAPRLKRLWLFGISFRALPKFLTTTDLVTLYLDNIPHSGYILPDEIVTCLSALTRLDRLSLGFRSPLSRPSQASRHPYPHTRAVLPALTYLRFRGVTEYLEDFVARVDTPLLRGVETTFFNQLVFDIVQLPKFLDRIDGFALLDSAKVTLGFDSISLNLSTRPQTGSTTSIELSVSCRKLDWQLSSLSQVCTSTLSAFSNLEHLDISEGYLPEWQDDMENIQWFELLHPFSTIKSLYLPDNVLHHVAPGLRELARGRVTEVLPALQVLFLDELEPSGHAHEFLREFDTARQHAGYPVAIRRREGRK